MRACLSVCLQRGWLYSAEKATRHDRSLLLNHHPPFRSYTFDTPFQSKRCSIFAAHGLPPPRTVRPRPSLAFLLPTPTPTDRTYVRIYTTHYFTTTINNNSNKAKMSGRHKWVLETCHVMLRNKQYLAGFLFLHKASDRTPNEHCCVERNTKSARN